MATRPLASPFQSPAAAGLADAEIRYRSIVETAVDGIITIDVDGTILTFNPAAERLFGYREADIIGRNVTELMPSEYRARHEGSIERYIATGRAGILGTGASAVAQRADGTTFPVRLAVGEMFVGGERYFTGVVRDETAAVAAERDLRRALEEQEALRRLTMSVAVEEAPESVCARAAEVVSRLLEVDFALVARFEDHEAHVLGSWSSHPVDVPPRRPMRGDGALAQVFRTGLPASVADYRALAADGDPAGLLAVANGCALASAAHPIHVSGQLWGAVLVATSSGVEPLPEDATERLGRVAHLVGLAVANAEARARLSDQAMTDPLTGLANHRVFHERLRQELGRAARHGRPLSVVLLDIDNFKRINDELGHQVGDRLIAEVGASLGAAGRPGDLIARVGGDEFGWILPETDAAGALAAAERARETIARGAIAGMQVTISAGVCDLARAGTGDELVRLADGALYWAKDSGRDAAVVYEPEVVHDLSPGERAEHLARRQALTAIRALARAVDAKDHSTLRHSERVAEVADALAGALGWDDRQRALLREAALLHDVGKIGVPDAVLFTPARLTDAEFEIVKAHAALGAEIAGEVLSAEQARWIREHHERVDGRGYPAGIAGDGISAGGRILALADAWDVMVSPRSYKPALSLDEAVAEVQRCAGTQFDAGLVALLVAIHQTVAAAEGLAED